MKKFLRLLFLIIPIVILSCEEEESEVLVHGEVVSSEDFPCNLYEGERDGKYLGFNCGKPYYSSQPEYDSKDGEYKFYSFDWQSDPQICVNTYGGVSEDSKTLITEVIEEAKKELGLLVPVNVFAFHSKDSNLEKVFSDWSKITLSCSIEFHEFNAAAGVEFNQLYNGGVAELSQGIFDMHDGNDYGSYARKIIYHEFFHIHQNSHKFYFESQNKFGINEKRETDRSGVNTVGPVWLEEGSAEFAAVHLSAKKGWVDYKYAMTEALDDARNVISEAASRNDIVSLRDYETSDGIRLVESENNPTGLPRQFAYQYTAGSWAFAYLWHLNYNNLQGALVDYYKNLAEIEKDNYGEGYKVAFEQTFGINLEQFYTDFDAFMLLPRDDQLSILK
tara:strand:- start:261 stop:1430 length:1170 start_codon:yes stop_codon:yes gene_type:complete